MVSIVLSVFVTGLGLLLWRIFRQYFLRSTIDHVPGPPRTSFLLGHFEDLMNWDGWKLMDDIVENYPGVVKLHGLFGEKQLYVSDPVALNSIFVKNQQNFEESDEFVIGNDILFGPGLISTIGDVHRKQRKILTPAFSTSHLRNLTPVFSHVAETLRNGIAEEVKSGSADVNVLHWMSRAALEIIGQGGVGQSLDPLTQSGDSVYADAINGLLPAVFSVGIQWFFISWTRYLGPLKFRRWLADMYPNKRAQKLKHIIDLVYKKAEDIIEMKKIALEKDGQQDGDGKDIISVLMAANMAARVEDRLPDDQLIAQVNTMIIAATDTTSNALSRVLHVLTQYPEAQETLRNEIIEARAQLGDEISYDRLMELPFLDAVCRETLRLYPPVLHVDRVAQEDIILPLWKPIPDVNGNMFQKISLTKGTTVTPALYVYNRIKAVWGDDATEWKPSRWLTPLPDTTKVIQGGSVFSNMMTFAGGSRACIGFKYAELEMKVILFYLLEMFKFSPGNAEIVWNSSHIVYPSATKHSAEGSLPLKVELVGTTL